MKPLSTHSTREYGFTLIEMLLVIAIIGIILSALMENIFAARVAAQDNFRQQSLNQLQNALEFYRDRHGSYPSTGGTWFSEGTAVDCNTHGYTGPNGYIPGLAPDFIPTLPQDPEPVDKDGCAGFSYTSDGEEFKIISQLNIGTAPVSGSKFFDPRREGIAYMVCSGEDVACEDW